MFLIPMYPSQGWEAAHATEEEGMQNHNVPTATPLAKPPLARTSSTFQQVAKESYGKKSSSHILGNGEIQT